MGREIDIETDDAFQKRDWRAERVMWAILLLFFLAGIFGLFGRGGLSYKKAGSEAEKIEIEYQRFLRYHTKDRLDITLYDLPQNAPTFSLEIDKAYTDKVQIENIHPKPEKTAITPNGTEYIFGNNNASEAKIIFYLHPDKPGKVKTILRYNKTHFINFSQYIYP